MRVVVSLLPFLLLAACAGGTPEEKPPGSPVDTDTDADTDTDTDTDTLTDEDIPVYSGTFTLPAPADLTTLALPPGPNGTDYSVLDAPNVHLTFDPTRRDAQTALAGCASLLIACYSPGVRNFPGCFANVPACATTSPWEEAAYCCDSSCGAAYAAGRTAGKAPVQAAIDAMYGETSCMPHATDWRAE